MNDEEYVVNHRHSVGAPYVQEIDEHDDGEDEKRALPVRRTIARIVDYQYPLDDGADKEGSRGLAGLPR